MNFALVASTELPSVFVGEFFINRYGRRWSHVFCMTVTTAFFICAIILSAIGGFEGIVTGRLQQPFFALPTVAVIIFQLDPVIFLTEYSYVLAGDRTLTYQGSNWDSISWKRCTFSASKTNRKYYYCHFRFNYTCEALLGCGSVQEVSVLALNSDDPSWNPAEVCSFIL